MAVSETEADGGYRVRVVDEAGTVVVELDGVLEAAAIGMPHEKSGEVVKLYVVRTDPSVTEDVPADAFWSLSICSWMVPTCTATVRLV